MCLVVTIVCEEVVFIFINIFLNCTFQMKMWKGDVCSATSITIKKTIIVYCSTYSMTSMTLAKSLFYVSVCITGLNWCGSEQFAKTVF